MNLIGPKPLTHASSFAKTSFAQNQCFSMGPSAKGCFHRRESAIDCTDYPARIKLNRRNSLPF